jgi:hypothetical protein
MVKEAESGIVLSSSWLKIYFIPLFSNEQTGGWMRDEKNHPQVRHFVPTAQTVSTAESIDVVC